MLFPWIEGDSLYATPDTPGAVPNSFRVAMTDVTQVEVAAPRAGAALHAVTLMLLVSVAAVVLVATSDLCVGLTC